MTDREKEAFIEGFMATSEGHNGEYAGSISNDAEAEAERQYEMWACDHEFGEWECEGARHGDRLRCERFCKHCPKSEYEFRDVDGGGE